MLNITIIQHAKINKKLKIFKNRSNKFKIKNVNKKILLKNCIINSIENSNNIDCLNIPINITYEDWK